MANPPSPDQQWVLSATAILTSLTRREPRHDCLGGAPKEAPDAEQTAKAILKNSWGIESREKLESTIEWLGAAGHTAEYQKVAAAVPTATPEQQKADPKLAFAAQYGAQIGARGLLAWDLARLFAVAGWGYLAGYCSDVEAWGVSMPGSQRLRAAYTSWEEFGQHYRLGCLFWSADAVGQTDSILAQLRSAADSPWRVTPWAAGAGPAAPAGAAYGAAAPAGPGYGPTVPSTAVPAPGYAAGVPGSPGYVGTPPPGAYGAVPGADAYAQANPGIYGTPPPAPSPYGAPGPTPYGAPAGAGAPYPAAAMVAGGTAPLAPGGPATAGGKKKTGLLLGLLAAGLVAFGLVFFLVWHFTHESSAHHEPAHEHEHPHGKH